MGKTFRHVDIPQCSDVGEVAVTARRTCVIRQSDLLCVISLGLFVRSVFSGAVISTLEEGIIRRLTKSA